MLLLPALCLALAASAASAQDVCAAATAMLGSVPMNFLDNAELPSVTLNSGTPGSMTLTRNKGSAGITGFRSSSSDR